MPITKEQMKEYKALSWRVRNCEPCKFCDKKALDEYQPCCTYPGRIELNEPGECITKRG